MSILSSGPGLFASLNNINPPTDLSSFQPYLDAGLCRFQAFTFVPNNALPTTADWYTTLKGKQPQGLDTNGGGTTDDWANFFSSLVDQNVNVGFTFGGQNATEGLGNLMEALNNNSSNFDDFVTTLQGYHVSFIHFDIEGSWETPPGFIDQFQEFAENLTSISNGTIGIEVGASAPIGTVNNMLSHAPPYLTPDFVANNNVYFNVYTYYNCEADNVVDANTSWIPSDTDIPASSMIFSLTCNNTTPAKKGQMDFTDFMSAFPGSDILATVKNQDYLGFDTWVWWQNTTTYPSANCLSLFQASAT